MLNNILKYKKSLALNLMQADYFLEFIGIIVHYYKGIMNCGNQLSFNFDLFFN